MIHETAFLKKAITPTLSALVIPDPDPKHPRQHNTNITTIVGAKREGTPLYDKSIEITALHQKLSIWTEAMPQLLKAHGMSTIPNEISRPLHQSLLRTDYPGFIRDLYITEDDSILHISPFPFSHRWQSHWHGWIYVTLDQMVTHHLDEDKAFAVALKELRQLEDFANNLVHAIAIQREGEEDVIISPIYTDGSGLPSKDTLDQVLQSSHTLSDREKSSAQTEPWRKAVKRVSWEQE